MLLTKTQLDNACQWLLKHAGPAIRYRTLTEIMGLTLKDQRVEAAYLELLQQSKRLQFIVSMQNPDGSFGRKSFHHGMDSTETYLRELLEMGVKPNFKVLHRGLEYTKKLYLSNNKDINWIPGIYLEPIGRAAPSRLVKEWFTDYQAKFASFLENHKNDWLITLKGKPATYFLEIPYIYVIRTIANSWWWLKEQNGDDISHILGFLLRDMASVSNLYWIAPNKQLFSFPNFFHILSSDVILSKVPSPLEFSIILEGLWLFAIFGIIEKYPALKNVFDFVSCNNNDDSVWDFPIKGMTKSKAGWHSYHGFSLEESWQKKESSTAELTFRICLIVTRNEKGHI